MYYNNCNSCPKTGATYQNCNQVVNKCFVEEIPHYTNYHTQVVNNCIRRHVNIPTFTQGEETVVSDEYVQGAPIYYNNMYQQPFQQFQYQQPFQQPYQYQQYQQTQTTQTTQESAQGQVNNQYNPFNF